MTTRKLASVIALASLLLPALAAHAVTIVQDPANDYVWFQAGQYDSLTNPGTSVITDNGDGTLTTTERGDQSSLATYNINFANPGNYFLYFRVDDMGGDSVFVNHQTGFNSIPGSSDAERWNSIETGWAGLYELLGDQSNYEVPAGDPAWGWSVPAASTVAFNVRNREADLTWQDFVFSQQNDLTVRQLDEIAGIPPPPIMFFEYTQTDKDTGFGTFSGEIDGITFTGQMPAATVTQNDTSGLDVPAGMIGYMDGVSVDQPGNPFGVHLNFDGAVVKLRGEKEISPTEVELYELELPLVIADDGTPEADWRYEVELTDDGGNGNDAFGTGFRIAGWIGDPTQGHRHSADGFGDFMQGAVDTRTVVGTHGDVGEHGRGDNLGIAISLRNGTFDSGSGPIYVDNLTWTGGLGVDASMIRRIPEPTTFALAALGLLAMLGWRRPACR